MLKQIENILGLDGANALRYADKKKGQHRTARLVRKGKQHEEAELTGFVLAGDVSAQAWIKTLLQDELPAQAYGRLLLLPGGKAPVALQSRGKPVCSCFSVSDTEIGTCLDGITQAAGGAGYLASDDDRLRLLQNKLKCGTNCGSCVPEIKRIIRTATEARHVSANGSAAAGRAFIPIRVLS